MKHFLISFFLVLIVSCRNNINDFEYEISGLQDKILDLENQLYKNKSIIIDLEYKISNKDSIISKLEDKVHENKSEILYFIDRDNINSQKVSSLEDLVIFNRNNLGDLQDRVYDLERKNPVEDNRENTYLKLRRLEKEWLKNSKVDK